MQQYKISMVIYNEDNIYQCNKINSLFTEFLHNNKLLGFDKEQFKPLQSDDPINEFKTDIVVTSYNNTCNSSEILDVFTDWCDANNLLCGGSIYAIYGHKY